MITLYLASVGIAFLVMLLDDALNDPADYGLLDLVQTTILAIAWPLVLLAYLRGLLVL